MLPPLRPRYYSISSSPLADPSVCSITVGVVEGPARSGQGIYRGVCSTYLAARPADGMVFALRPQADHPVPARRRTRTCR